MSSYQHDERTDNPEYAVSQLRDNKDANKNLLITEGSLDEGTTGFAFLVTPDHNQIDYLCTVFSRGWFRSLEEIHITVGISDEDDIWLSQWQLDLLMDSLSGIGTLRKLRLNSNHTYQDLDLPWRQLDIIHIEMPHSIKQAVYWLSQSIQATSVTLKGVGNDVRHSTLFRQHGQPGSVLLPKLKHLVMYGTRALDPLAYLFLPNVTNIDITPTELCELNFNDVRPLEYFLQQPSSSLEYINISPFGGPSNIDNYGEFAEAIFAITDIKEKVPSLSISFEGDCYNAFMDVVRELSVQSEIYGQHIHPKIYGWCDNQDADGRLHQLDWTNPKKMTPLTEDERVNLEESVIRVVGWKKNNRCDSPRECLIFTWDGGKIDIFVDADLFLDESELCDL